jgi:hypothetical protein
MRRVLLGSSIALVVALLLGCPKGPENPPPQTGPDEDPEAAGEAALTPTQMEEVQRTVQAGMPAVTRCYTEELERRKDKAFQGKVVVKILIGTAEAATQVDIGDTELQAPAVHDCIREVIRGWEFPRLKKAAWFTYPFAFSPAY